MYFYLQDKIKMNEKINENSVKGMFVKYANIVECKVLDQHSSVMPHIKETCFKSKLSPNEMKQRSKRQCAVYQICGMRKDAVYRCDVSDLGFIYGMFHNYHTKLNF
jgi:hypothetical protein